MRIFESQHKKDRLIFILIISFIFTINTLFAQEKEQSKYFILKNGLKVFLLEKHKLPLVNLVTAFNVGSKDESEETSGLVHILEHYILFRGTEFRTGDEIARDIRCHGAYFNAHTGRDIVTIESTLPSEYTEFALQNQKEISFNLKLIQKELDEEKQIILEEINNIHDDPLRYATSLVYQNLFKNHPYQKPVYGKKETIETLNIETIEKFYKTYFIPSNCAIVLVGDFHIHEIEGKIKKMYGDLENPGYKLPKYEKVYPLEKSIEIEHEMDVNLAYTVIGMIGPDYNDKDQYTIDILTEILGHGINPLLYTPLRKRRVSPESLTMDYGTYEHGGAILISLTLDSRNVRIAQREILQFLKRLKNFNFSKKDYYGESQFDAFDFLQSAKNRIKLNTYRSQESGLLTASSLARFMLLNKNKDRGNYLHNVNKVSSSDLRHAAGKYLGIGRYVIVSIIPKKKK